MSPKNGLQSVVSDAEWLPTQWDRSAGTLQFVHAPRARHSELTFLAEEYLRPAGLPTEVVAVPGLLSAAQPGPAAAHFIFHSAFCCSTLLARALDIPGKAMALKEPQILNELADAARAQVLSADILGLTLRLLARPFAEGESLIIKPSNVVNALGPALMNADERSRAIFLYAPLSRFLGSIAAKGLWGRRWARRLYAQLLGDTGLQFGFGEAEQFELSDLQVAALAWLMHHVQGMNLLRQFPERVRTLDSEMFLANPAAALEALGRHFRFDLGSEQAEAIAHGPVFATDSKKIGRKFDPEGSLEPRQSTAAIDEEIEMVVTWTNRVAEHVGVPMELPRKAALLGA